ncbi:MAG TPA: decaprenyl-phosphate phosphoribosyltransferase [Candidatus Limnocylindrales bacterium]|nr:decaprenyl-phosphate phosphoribosyltransferase [Candidatus Limnocylindrales bacterium]
MRRHLFELLRPTHWVKNGFVLAAFVFSLNRTSEIALVRTVAAFVIFCLASSSAYVLNDVLDASRDRLHPEKRLRPVACGAVSRRDALVLALALAVAALAGSLLVDLQLFLCTAAFLTLQAAYSSALKRVAVIDAMAIAGGFVLRTMAGVIAAGAQMSAWLFLSTFLLALFLALAKRRHELLELGDQAGDHRDVLERYRQTPLDTLIVLLALAVIGVYVQYTLSSDVAARLGTTRLYVTVPFVVFGVFRYLFLVYGHEKGGNPTNALLDDHPLQIGVALWAATVVVLLYA